MALTHEKLIRVSRGEFAAAVARGKLHKAAMVWGANGSSWEIGGATVAAKVQTLLGVQCYLAKGL